MIIAILLVCIEVRKSIIDAKITCKYKKYKSILLKISCEAFIIT